MRPSKFATKAFVIVLLTLCLSSCGGPTANPKVSKLIEITYWRTLTGVAGGAQDELVERFNAQHNNIHITSEFQGSYSDLATKLLMASVDGVGPQVTQLGSFEIRQFAKSGMLADLTPLLKGPDGFDTSAWPQTLAQAGEVDGKVYWLPFNVSVPVVYYNKTAFGDAGLSGPPATWDEFFDDIKKLTKRDDKGNVQRAGAAFWSITWPLFSMIWSEGGELTTRDYSNITLNDPVVVRLLTQIQKLVHDDDATFPDKASGGHRAAFLSGRAAMILDSQDAFGQVFDGSTAFSPGIANYPAGSKGKVYAPGGGGLAIRAAASDAERKAAWEFIRFMLAPEQLAEYARKSGYCAFTKESQAVAGDFLKDERYAVIHAALPFVRGDFSVNMSPAVRTAFDEAFQKILVDNADVQTTLDAADAQAEKNIKTELAAH